MTKKLTEKPFCGGTLTRAGFFGKIRSALRRLSMFWAPKNVHLDEVKRPKINGGRSKWEFPCVVCKEWFIKAHVHVDHIIPCGALNSFEDIGPFVERLLCEKEGFQVVCKVCHQLKSNEERASGAYKN